MEKHAPKFQTANGKHWEKIVKKVADQIEKTWPKDMGLDRVTVIGVSNLSGKLDHSQIFLAYLQAPIGQI